MDTPALVSIDAGQKLVAALDDTYLKVRSAFWYYAEEASEWRLALVVPAEGGASKGDAYEAVQRVLRKEQINIPLSRISIVEPDSQLARAVRGNFPRTPGKNVILTPGTGRLSLSTGGYADDCLIYHVYRST